MSNLAKAIKILRNAKWNKFNIERAVALIQSEEREIKYGQTGCDVEIIIKGWNGDEPCQHGVCPTCEAVIFSSRKQCYCPCCGEEMYCT